MKQHSVLRKKTMRSIVLIFWPALMLINITWLILLFAFHEALDLRRFFTVDPTYHLQVNDPYGESGHDDRL